MIILVATATGQNSAYRHRNYEGRFRKRRRPSLLLLSRYRWRELRFFAKERQNFFHQRVGCDTVFFAQDWNGTVLDELIGPTDARHGRTYHLRVQMFHHSATETIVQNVVFDRADDFHAARKEFERAG